jgi:hypothetical protein
VLGIVLIQQEQQLQRLQRQVLIILVLARQRILQLQLKL